MATGAANSAVALKGFAKERGLSYAATAEMPVKSSLLNKDEARATNLVAGELARGVSGLLFALHFQVKQGNDRPPEQREITACAVRIPESISHIPWLTAHDAGGRRGIGTLLFGPGGALPFFDKVELESIKFNKTYRVGVMKGQDESFTRQLFTPTFIDYLAENAPEGCFFELVAGVLTVTSSEPLLSERELTEFCELAGRVGERIRGECRESAEISPELRRPPNPQLVELERRRLAEVDRVEWEEPPETVAEASRPYRRFAWRKPMTWIVSLGLSALMSIFMGAIIGFFSIIIGGGWGLLIGFLAGGGAFFAWMFPTILRGTVRGESTNAGLIAFMRGYGESRDLKWESLAALSETNPMAGTAGNGSAALRGRIGSRKESTLVASLETSARNPKGQLALSEEATARTAAHQPLLLPAKGEGDPPARLGGFLLQGIKGLDESDTDQAERKRAEALAAKVRGGDESIGVMLEGDRIMVATAKADARDWTAESVDEFCDQAREVIKRLSKA